MSLADIVQRGWDAVGTGDFDALVTYYVEGMTFIMPGQTDILEGRKEFRTALDNLGESLPQGLRLLGTGKLKEKARLSRSLNGNRIKLYHRSCQSCLSLRIVKFMRNVGL